MGSYQNVLMVISIWQSTTSWWFQLICSLNWIPFPQGSGRINKYLKPPPGYSVSSRFSIYIGIYIYIRRYHIKNKYYLSENLRYGVLYVPFGFRYRVQTINFGVPCLILGVYALGHHIFRRALLHHHVRSYSQQWLGEGYLQKHLQTIL